MDITQKPSCGITLANIVLHSCIRAHKIGWEVRKAGNQVILVSENLNYVHPWWGYNAAVKLYVDPENPADYPYWQIRKTVEAIDQLIDVYHIHNEPDWLVPVVRSVTDKPIIYDIHDMKSIREGKVDEWEQKAFDQCNAFSVVSRRYQDIVQSRSDKPVEEILSCVNEEFFPKERCKLQHKGVVYEGGLRPKSGSQGVWQEFPCREWTDAFRKIVQTGTPMWAYQGNTSVDLSEYSNFGTMIMGPLRYDALIQNLTAFEAGLVGSPQPDPMFDGAIPNKFFEYMAAGLPILAYNAGKAVNEFILACNIGAILDDLSEIPDVLEVFRKHKLRDHVWQLRHGWTMQSQIKKIMGLYNQVLGRSISDDQQNWLEQGHA